MTKSIDQRLASLERSLILHKRLNLILMLFIGMALSVAAVASVRTNIFGIIRAKGIIIEDSQGRPRIAIGAPLANIPGRARTDAIEGIVYIDPNGKDRLTFGREPDPMTTNGIIPRRVGGAGILIHDKDGVERGGYSVLDDDSALLTVDWPKSGEAVALSSNAAFSGVGLFYRSEIGSYRDSIGMFTTAQQNRAFLKVSDTSGQERATLLSEGTTQPRILQYDAAGKEIERKP